MCTDMIIDENNDEMKKFKLKKVHENSCTSNLLGHVFCLFKQINSSSYNILIFVNLLFHTISRDKIQMKINKNNYKNCNLFCALLNLQRRSKNKFTMSLELHDVKFKHL